MWEDLLAVLDFIFGAIGELRFASRTEGHVLPLVISINWNDQAAKKYFANSQPSFHRNLEK